MKSFTLVLCVLALLGAAASTALFLVIGNTKAALHQELNASQARATGLETQLTDARTEGERLQKRLAAIDADLGDTKSRLSATELRAIQLSRDLNQTRTLLATKEETERQLNQDIAALKRELVQSRLAASAAASPEEVAGYRQTIAQLTDKVSTLETTLRHATSVASLASPSSATVTAARSRAAPVVSVGPQNAFVVLAYGASHGARSQQELQVLRGTQPVATVHISDVRENYSIAQVVPSSLSGALQKGDVASILN